MHLKKFRSVALTSVTLLTLAAVTASAQSPGKKESMQMDKPDQVQMEKMMGGWPKASMEAVMFMTKKYGPPAAMSKEMAVWGKTGPWKRTIVYAQEYVHEFPMHHTDVMQQFIDYKAPADKYDELAQYDGSVVVERTTGEISARCDKEEANFLALNLAHEIVTGKRKVKDARRMYGEQIMAMKAGKPAPYTEKFLFQVATGGTGDPDAALVNMAMEKTKK